MLGICKDSSVNIFDGRQGRLAGAFGRLREAGGGGGG